MKKIFKSIDFIYHRFRITRKISKLSIKKTGISDKLNYIELLDGTIFYGKTSRAKDHKFYNLLPKKIKSVLAFDFYQIAFDIIVRYNEGGLKLGGPLKEKYYTVKEGDYIAEMGAYMGYYTLYLSKKVGDKGKIIAIEPLESNLIYLKKNISSNNINNVHIVEKGVWNKKERLTFYKKVDDNQSGSFDLVSDDKEKFTLNADSLDNILSDSKVDHIDFIIIQLNGAEPEALEGLTKINPKNFSIAARYKKGNTDPVQDIITTLKNRNYKTFISKKFFIYAYINE